MFSLVGRLMLLLWPFFKEVFLKNEDVQYAVRRNWISMVLFGILSLALIVFLQTTGTFRKTHEQYTDLTTEHTRLVEVRDSLREELTLVSEQFDSLEGRIRQVVESNRQLRQENDELTAEVESFTCTGNEPTRRSEIQQRLRLLRGE